MRQFFITMAGTIAGIFGFFALLFILFIFIGLLGALSSIGEKTPDKILTLDLRQSMIDHSIGDSLFGESPNSIVDTVYALNRAKDDDSVKGVFIRAENFGMAPASAEELRLALLDFKTSGKFVIAHAQGFESTSLMSYQAVSAADEIWMQDTTGFAVSGMHSESEFFGGVMEKLDAKPELFQFHEYKNAVNSYTEKGFTEAHREATTSYLTSIYDNAVAQIATDRDMTSAGVSQVLKASPHSAEDALEAGMVDKGSPAASDQILAAADRAKEAGKPIVISMGQYAASGGYYVAAHADHIVALPQTITGSIGVFGGKVALEGTFAKIGYNIEGITVGGEFSGAYSADAPFTPTQAEAYRGQLQDIYDDFITRVSNGRDMPLDRVKEIAKGRVWTGAQAKEIGLVDELGGIMAAIDAAKTLADIDVDDDVRIKIFPRQKSIEEQINDIFTGSAQIAEDIKTLQDIAALPEVQAAIRARNSARFGQELKAGLRAHALKI